MRKRRAIVSIIINKLYKPKPTLIIMRTLFFTAAAVAAMIATPEVNAYDLNEFAEVYESQPTLATSPVLTPPTQTIDGGAGTTTPKPVGTIATPAP